MEGEKYFRPKAIFACVALSLMHAGFLAQRGCASDAAPRESAITAAEDRVIAALPVVPPDLNGKYALKIEPAKHVSILYTCKVHAPRLAATNWIFFAVRPPDLPSQTVSRATMTPAGTAVADLSPLRRPLLRVETTARSEVQRHEAAVEVRMDAELFARRLVAESHSKGTVPFSRRANPQAGASSERENRDSPPNLTAAQRRLALRPAGLCDYTNESFRDWMARNGLTCNAKEGEVDFARRVFVYLVKNFRYEYTGDEQDRSLAHVCAMKKSDCGGLSVLFVAAMRSQGVPGRALVGRWAISATHGKHADDQCHVKAEFFAQGVGWVPVDVSSAVLWDKTAERLEYFGRDKGDHLAFCVDTGVPIDTRYFGVKTITWLQSACYWATGTGNFDGEVVEEDWKVVDVPPQPTRTERCAGVR